MTRLVLWSCIGVGGWVLLASLIAHLPARYRLPAFWGLVAIGVPGMGWLTLNWGPGIGVAAFALGLLLLITMRHSNPPPSSDPGGGESHP